MTVGIENQMNDIWSQDDGWEQTAAAEEAGIQGSIQGWTKLFSLMVSQQQSTVQSKMWSLTIDDSSMLWPPQYKSVGKKFLKYLITFSSA